jgi:hypothetical protein
MKNPVQNITTPMMAEKAIQPIGTDLNNNVSWLTGWVFGLTFKGVYSNTDTFPKIANIITGDSFDIQPDNSLKAYCFFELNDPVKVGEDYNTFNIDLIVWGNLTKVDSTNTYDFTSELINQVIARLKAIAALQLIDTNSISFYENPENIYDYTHIKQTKTQFATRPYFCFRINFDVLASCTSGWGGCTGGGTCSGVNILDQNGTVIHHVPDGGTYSVEVLTEIVDTSDSNTSVIIDTI